MSKLARFLVGATLPVLGCFAAVGIAGPADIQLPPETAQLRPSELAGFVDCRAEMRHLPLGRLH